MLVVLAAITSWITLVTTVLIFWRTLRQDKVLDEHTEKMEKIASSVNGELDELQARADAMKERADRTAEFAREMQAYASSLRKSLAIIDRAEKAGEHVVNIHSTISSPLVQDPLAQDPPTMLDP